MTEISNIAAAPAGAPAGGPICWKCKGRGAKPRKPMKTAGGVPEKEQPCPTCGGTGSLPAGRRWAHPSDKRHALGICLRESEPTAAEATSEPLPGDKVYVVGHGPATLFQVLSGKGKFRYKVLYPNGTTYHVCREHILVHEAAQEAATRQAEGSATRGCTGVGSTGVSVGGPRQLEYLGRAFNDSGRHIRTPSAIFSLVATMVGGGVLSLPYAMSQCGILLGTVALILSAVVSGWTLDMLIDCARCTGRDTFELVGHAAFGELGRRLTIWLVFLLCWLVLIGYFVLLGDLVVPLVELAFPQLQNGSLDAENLRRVILACATVFLAPMCFKSNLHALRFLCFASVGSVLIVGIVVGIRALQCFNEPHRIWTILPNRQAVAATVLADYKWMPTDWAQALYVFPMFGVSFLCHFNALPTHQELQRPTRLRIRRVLAMTVGLTTLLYLSFGVLGYLYGCVGTCGNILLNFSSQDPFVVISRAALGGVLSLNFPLICQPCRNAFYRLVSGYLAPRHGAAAEAGCATSGTPVAQDGAAESGDAQVQEAESRPSDAHAQARVHVYLREATAGLIASSALEAYDTYLPKDETVLQSAAESTVVQRYVLTTLLLGSALLVSLFMKSVLVVWSVMGSTVCFLVAFILPALFWYRIVGPFAGALQRCGAICLLGISIVLAILCTVLTIMKLDTPACPMVTDIREESGAYLAAALSGAAIHE